MYNKINENKIFNMSDSEIEKVLEEANEVQFYGNKVKNFNERECRIAIGYLARMLIYEQNRLLRLVTFSQTTLETINFRKKN